MSLNKERKLASVKRQVVGTLLERGTGNPGSERLRN